MQNNLGKILTQADRYAHTLESTDVYFQSIMTSNVKLAKLAVKPNLFPGLGIKTDLTHYLLVYQC